MRSAVMCSLAMALITGPAAAASQQSCNDGTLHGSYILSANGMDKTPISEAGMIFYDGSEQVSFKGKYANNAEISLKGKYEVAKNCRGEVTYEDGRTVTLFIAPSGDEISWVVTSGPILASNSKRVSKNDLVGMKP